MYGDEKEMRVLRMFYLFCAVLLWQDGVWEFWNTLEDNGISEKKKWT